MAETVDSIVAMIGKDFDLHAFRIDGKPVVGLENAAQHPAAAAKIKDHDHG